ncbi:hypothetical protein QBC39DRAFT_125771 [Podospora conica]|nr:hypothetical protein QBC39DRAFT_125771 [Schizothecium conicum]
MRFSFAIVATLLGLTNANFDLYAGTEQSLGGFFMVWTIHQTPPDCKRVNQAETYLQLDDVSGNKVGVRCEGSGCSTYQPSNVNVVEMHFSNNPLFHFTIYKDRGHPYKMYGRDGKTYGECIVFTGDTFDCISTGLLGGVRMYRCLTQFNVAQIESAR